MIHGKQHWEKPCWMDFRLNHFLGLGLVHGKWPDMSGRGDAVWDVVFTRIEWRDISRKWRWREVEQLTIVVVDMVGQLLALVSIVLAIGKEPWTLFHTFAYFCKVSMINYGICSWPHTSIKVTDVLAVFLDVEGVWYGMFTPCLPWAWSKETDKNGRRCFFHSFPLHLKFKAMKFFTVRDTPGIPGKCLAETTDMFPQVEKLRFVHVCTGFSFNKSYPNNKHRCLELPRFLGTEYVFIYIQDMFYIWL